MGEISKEIKRLKGNALKRRMRSLKQSGEKWATEQALARVFGGHRQTVAKWKQGESWPSMIEEKVLEQWLRVPVGFFEAIGSGIPYERAIQGEPAPPLPSPPRHYTEAEVLDLIDQIEQIMHVIKAKLAKTKDHTNPTQKVTGGSHPVDDYPLIG